MATVRGGKDYAVVLATGSEDPVAPTVQTTVATYTADAFRRIAQVSCSGDVAAKWVVEIDGDQVDAKRATDRNAVFDWDWPLSLQDGQTLDVKVTHYKALETPAFEATIYGK